MNVLTLAPPPSYRSVLLNDSMWKAADHYACDDEDASDTTFVFPAISLPKDLNLSLDDPDELSPFPPNLAMDDSELPLPPPPIRSPSANDSSKGQHPIVASIEPPYQRYYRLSDFRSTRT